MSNMASIPAEGFPSDQSLFFSYLVHHHFVDGERERHTTDEEEREGERTREREKGRLTKREYERRREEKSRV